MDHSDCIEGGMTMRSHFLLILISGLLLFLSGNSPAFDLPMWDSSARWEVVRLGGSCTDGFLQGPIAEMEANALGGASGGMLNGYETSEGAKNFYGWFDLKAMRAHAVSGTAQGHLDGPFSRARFAGWGYNFNPINVFSNDNRYMYVTENWQGQMLLRRLDFKMQIVKTIMVIPTTNSPGITFKPDGTMLMLTSDLKLSTVDTNGTITGTTQLDTSAGIIRLFYREMGLAYDEVHNRLYCGQTLGNWYVSYWNLDSNRFYGVVPSNSSVKRAINTPGPFDGTNFYTEGSCLRFGPDDPEKRFLYMTHVDTYQAHRIDLQRGRIATLIQEGTIARYSDSVSGKVPIYASSFRMDESGNLFGCMHSPTVVYMFKRVK